MLHTRTTSSSILPRKETETLPRSLAKCPVSAYQALATQAAMGTTLQAMPRAQVLPQRFHPPSKAPPSTLVQSFSPSVLNVATARAESVKDGRHRFQFVRA